MNFTHSFARALAPVAIIVAVAAPAVAAPSAELKAVEASLAATQSMTADFLQTSGKGQQLAGTLSLKRPGKIRFDYGRSANMLIVGDGRALTFVDYDARDMQRWPIDDSPLSVLLNPGQDLGRFARVVRDDNQVLMIEARDPRRREFGTITVAFARVPGAPAGLMLQGWNTVDAQNHLTSIRLSGQRFNVPVADSLFTYRNPTRRGPRG